MLYEAGQDHIWIAMYDRNVGAVATKFKLRERTPPPGKGPTEPKRNWGWMAETYGVTPSQSGVGFFTVNQIAKLDKYRKFNGPTRAVVVLNNGYYNYEEGPPPQQAVPQSVPPSYEQWDRVKEHRPFGLDQFPPEQVEEALGLEAKQQALQRKASADQVARAAANVRLRREAESRGYRNTGIYAWRVNGDLPPSDTYGRRTRGPGPYDPYGRWGGTRRRMKNPSWKGYNLHCTKKNRKGTGPRTRRRNK